MISIIICSKNNALANDLKENIGKTIGVAYEVIAIDNAKANNGICAVYNKGAALAKYPVLCFMHEDVLFKTMDWGTNLINHFKDPTIGLIGVAGGDSMSKVPSMWSNSIISNEINILENRGAGPAPLLTYASARKNGEIKMPVVAMDGVFICVRKAVFEEFKFDETVLQNFHGYDVDYSLQVATKYKNYVVFNILLHHFSVGSLNKAWLNSVFLIADKWQKTLPLYIHDVSFAQQQKHHWQTLHFLIKYMFSLNIGLGKTLATSIKYSFTKFFSFKNFLSFSKLFFALLLDRWHIRKRMI